MPEQETAPQVPCIPPVPTLPLACPWPALAPTVPPMTDGEVATTDRAGWPQRGVIPFLAADSRCLHPAFPRARSQCSKDTGAPLGLWHVPVLRVCTARLPRKPTPAFLQLPVLRVESDTNTCHPRKCLCRPPFCVRGGLREPVGPGPPPFFLLLRLEEWGS